MEKRRILLIEDDPIVAVMISEGLDEHEMNVTAVGSVKAAFDELFKRKFDCVILDMKLGAERGEEVIHFMRLRNKLNRTTPILVVSAFLTPDTRKRITSQVNGILAKPFQFSALRGALHQLISPDSTPPPI